LLEAAHDAWCKGDVEGVLGCYADDCTYWCNAGSHDGVPFAVEGKPAFRVFLQSIVAAAESRSVIEHFQFEDGVGRAQVEAYIRHRGTGHVLAGSFRQIVTFSGHKIVRLEEYHDAAKMAAFWRLVASEETADDAK
jgi:ketosteroid isomerase-like protein